MQIFQYGPAEIDHLKRRDKKLGRAIDHIGVIERQVMPDLFQALVHSVRISTGTMDDFLVPSNIPCR